MSRTVEVFEPIPSTISEILDGFGKAGCPYRESVWTKEFLDIEIFSHPEVKEYIGRVFPTEPSETGLKAFVIESEKWDRKIWRNHFIRYFKDTVDPVVLAFVPKGFELNEHIDAFALTIILSEGSCDVPAINHVDTPFRAARIWTEVVNASINEELSEFEATLAAASHKTRVSDVLEAIDARDNDLVFAAFESLGLKCISEGVYEARPGSPLIEAVLFVDVTKSSKSLTSRILRDISNRYYEKHADRPDWLITLTSDSITYYSSPNDLVVRFKLVRTDFEESSQILTALIAVVDRHSSYNSETFANQFGKYSPLCAMSISSLETYFSDNQKKVETAFNEWKRLFERVYRRGDTDRKLFIQHSYLSLLVRITLMVKYLPADLVRKEALEEVISYFENRGVSLFINDFFHWATTIPAARAHLFFALRHATFDADDVFRTIYQQMVSPETRKALGEFYTPPELASMMVEDSYRVGQMVLDPACGSGTFLVEIALRIINSSESREEKILALKKIYGFDVNPIAVSVSKANLLLLLTHFYANTNDLPIQIFLCDSLYPITWELQETLELGKTIVFEMHSINQRFPFSSVFFEKEKRPSFTRLLTQIDYIITNSIQMDSAKEKVYELLKYDDYKWVWNNTGYLERKDVPTLVENLMKFVDLILELGKDDKNHIWIYLLFNALGAEEIERKIDLCIGNPPWLVINGVYSATQKQRMKTMAEALGILPKPHNISNLEISALFLYRCRDMYLKDNGIIFFVVSNAFIAGSNHDGTRNFRYLDKIEIWKFDEDLFNIHNICLKATKNTTMKRNPRNLVVAAHYFQQDEHTAIAQLERKHTEELVPYDVITEGNRVFVKKLITREEKKKLLPRGDNYYESQICRGAEINPQNLVFVHILETNGSEATIVPRKPIYAKKPWTFTPFKTSYVERKYLYKVVGSLELVPFIILRSSIAFLPLNPDMASFNDIEGKAKGHLEMLESKFRKYAKDGLYADSLVDVLDYRTKLTAREQRSQIKVVVNVSGTQVKAAVIQGKCIVSSTLYYLSSKSLSEAYYFATLIQAPVISHDVQLRQSEGAGGHGRHIHKRVYDYKYSKFNPKNPLHIEIEKLGRRMNEISHEIASDFITLSPIDKPPLPYSIEEKKIPIQTIRNSIYNALSDEYSQLDKLVLSLLEESE